MVYSYLYRFTTSSTVKQTFLTLLSIETLTFSVNVFESYTIYVYVLSVLSFGHRRPKTFKTLHMSAY